MNTRQRKQSRKQSIRKKSKSKRAQKDVRSKSIGANRTKGAPSDKLKHLKTKQQKAVATNNNREDNELLNSNAALSLREMDQLDNYIHEYLSFHGYDKTMNAFERERITNSYTKIKLQRDPMHQNIVDDDAMRNEILHQIISMFDANDISGIFKLWNRYLSPEVLNGNAYAIKLECHLQIYQFVTELNRHSNQSLPADKLNNIRNTLQQYFTENGQRLALCNDVLPYFSLPFVENARSHPVFAQFFETAFAHNLRLVAIHWSSISLQNGT